MIKSPLIIASILFCGALAYAGPSDFKGLKQPLTQSQKMGRPAGKPNLIISSISWSDETCVETCLKVKNDLHINKPCSPLIVRVHNTGHTKSGQFQVTLTYVDWRSMQGIKRMSVNNLGAGQSIDVTFTGANAVGYYLTSAPFGAFADSNSRVDESNEMDNIKSVTFN